jgi:hypothetical protein
MEFFTIWFEKCFYKISKGHGSSFVGLSFAKCYINDIIAISLIPSDHMHHLWKVFERL